MYLEHIITADGVSVAPHNVHKIVNFPTSRNKRELKRLLGLFGYYRSLLPHFSEICAPFIRLRNKDTDFEWMPEQEKILLMFKARITTAPILRLAYSTTRSGQMLGHGVELSRNYLTGM